MSGHKMSGHKIFYNNVKSLQNCIKIFVKNKIYNKTMKTKWQNILQVPECQETRFFSIMSNFCITVSKLS